MNKLKQMFKVTELNNQLQHYYFLLYDANNKDVVFKCFIFLYGNSGQALPVR